MRTLPLAALSALLLPVAAHAQVGVALELRAGAVLGSQALGTSTGPSTGYFELGEVEAGPMIGVGLVLPEVVLGIRPLARVSYALAADVGGNWFPCEPRSACPDVLLPVDGSASRLQGTAGLQLPILAPAGPVRPYASAAVGFRRYGVSWEAVGEPGGLHLAAGSHRQTDWLASLGIGATIALGGYEALVEGVADFGTFAAGRVPVPEELLALWAEPTIDLGRETIREYEVVVGLRRYLR